MRLLPAVAGLAGLLSGIANAQQYAGDVIPNKLPKVNGAELAYFHIGDPAKKNNNLTLINYYSLQADGSRVDPTQLQRAVIVLCGNRRDPYDYIAYSRYALGKAALVDPNVNYSTVALFAPYFPDGDDKNVGYPWTDGLPPGHGSTSNALVWKGSQWAPGSYNQYPYTSTNTSSFDVLDQLVHYFNDATIFPNIKQVIVSGHSEGAQQVQHYAAIGQKLPLRLPIQYWVANPNDYLWFTDTRPFQTASCPTYNSYRDGLANFTEYPMRYGVNLVNQGGAAVLANYQSRGIAYARGTLDFGDDSSDCNPFSQGQNRNERFFEFIKAFPPTCPDPAGNNCDTVDYIVSAHDAQLMMSSPPGQQRLFFDNFYGNHSRAYDMSYPRMAVGDDPYPNPALVGTPPPFNPTIYAGGMHIQGCWANQDPPAFTNMAYEGTNNTLAGCTTTCSSTGNLIAALMNGTECYCGNSMAYDTVKVVNSSCKAHCSGAPLKVCGGSNRLSVFSKNKPVIAAPPAGTTSSNSISKGEEKRKTVLQKVNGVLKSVQL